MQNGYIKLGKQELHYLRMGRGSELLLAFHGYANDASLFALFEQHLSHRFTIISINLPFHGLSNWASPRPLLPQDLVTIVTALLKEYSCSKASLMGYSMGGRVCLSIIEQMPSVVDKVLLIAPDGLVFNTFYYLAMRTNIGKVIFNYTLTHPKRFLSLLDGLKKIKLLDPSRHKFLKGHMQSDKARNFLLNVWPAMRRILPNRKTVRNLIQQHAIDVDIYMGVYDRIIVPRYAYKFSKGLPQVHVHILQKGHQLFDEKSVAEMANSLKS